LIKWNLIIPENVSEFWAKLTDLWLIHKLNIEQH